MSLHSVLRPRIALAVPPRVRLRLILLVALSGCAGGMQGSAVTEADLAIRNVGVVDVAQGRVIPDQAVLVKDGRIIAVGPSRELLVPGTSRVIDGKGKYLMPGLLDMHVHLHLSGKPTQVEMPLFVAHGVTGVRVMAAGRGAAETRGLAEHRDWQARIEAGTLTGPRLLAVASWPVNGEAGITDSMPGFYRARTRAEGQELARYFQEGGFDFIKVYNNVSREGYLGMAEESRRLGMPFGGHEPASLSAIELSNAGQNSIEHSRVFLFNCFPGADSLQQGLLRTSATERRRRMVDEYDPQRCALVFEAFRRNRTYITPTHLTRRMDALAGDSGFRRDPRLRYLPLRQQVEWLEDADGMVASDPSPAGRRSYLDFYLKGLSLTGDAFRAGVPVMLGTDAGDSFVFPGSSVHDELGELVRAGLTPAEALRAATLTGATYLGRAADFGAVAPRRYADLLVLDANPLDDIGNSRRIRTVVLGGRVFDRARLDSMLAEVERVVRPAPQEQLWAASILGDTAAISRALSAGAAIDSLDPARNRRPLNYAALNNRGSAVRLLLARGAGLNLANRTGFTPLHHAAEAGAIDALRILLAAGADPTLTTTRGQRPLDIARARRDEAAIAALEGAGVRPRE